MEQIERFTTIINEDKALSLFLRYAVSLAVVILSIIISINLPPLSQASSLFIVLASILFQRLVWRVGPGLFTTLVAIMGVHYCLMVPRHSLVISSNFDLLRLILFVVTSVGVVVFFQPSSRPSSSRAGRRRTHSPNRPYGDGPERMNGPDWHEKFMSASVDHYPSSSLMWHRFIIK